MSDVKWGTAKWRPMLTLMDDVARRLTGLYWVSVRPRKPYLKGARGSFHPMPHGRGLIDLDPDLDTETAFRTFLHECAHGRHTYKTVTSEAAAHRPPASIEPDWKAIKSAGYQATENRLWDQADHWDVWATRNIHRVKRPLGDAVLDKLQALKTIEVYRKGE